MGLHFYWGITDTYKLTVKGGCGLILKKLWIEFRWGKPEEGNGAIRSFQIVVRTDTPSEVSLFLRGKKRSKKIEIQEYLAKRGPGVLEYEKWQKEAARKLNAG